MLITRFISRVMVHYSCSIRILNKKNICDCLFELVQRPSAHMLKYYYIYSLLVSGYNSIYYCDMMTLELMETSQTINAVAIIRLRELETGL